MNTVIDALMQVTWYSLRTIKSATVLCVIEKSISEIKL